MSKAHYNYNNESGIVANELAGFSEVFADNADQQEGKLEHIVQRVEELKTLIGERSGDSTILPSFIVCT